MDKKVMIITGSSRGIGKYLSQYYAQAGVQVIGVSRNSADFEVENYRHFNVDVSDEVEVKNIFSSIKKEYGRLDYLINNAGVAAMNHSLLTPIKSVTKLLNTNVLGTFLLSREAAKLMSKNKFGRIVNFSTVAVPLKLKGEAVYAASKSAVNSLTQVLSNEYAELGITVNAIGPTPIKTDLTRSVPENKLEEIIQQQAIKRMGQFEDVSNVIDFFLKKESDFITGQIIYLGGIS